MSATAEGPYRRADQGPPPSYVVALTRWGRPLEDEVGWLAASLGGPPHELRRRLSGPIPVIYAWTQDQGVASAQRSALRERGHGAVVCDVSRVVPSRQMTCPRDFELTDRALLARGAEGPAELPYVEIGGIVWARRAATSVSRTVETRRVWSSGAALLTGGLVTSRQRVSTEVSEATTVETVVYLFRAGGARHFLLAEESLRYGGLGAGRAPTRARNFRLLIDGLRARAPGAIFDARLATSPARVAGPGPAGSVDPTDLAAHLVLIARLQDQI